MTSTHSHSKERHASQDSLVLALSITGVLFVVELVAGFLTNSLVGPLLTIAFTLIYYDLRVRKEGFDLQLMMTSLGASPDPNQACSLVCKMYSLRTVSSAMFCCSLCTRFSVLTSGRSVAQSPCICRVIKLMLC